MLAQLDAENDDAMTLQELGLSSPRTHRHALMLPALVLYGIERRNLAHKHNLGHGHATARRFLYSEFATFGESGDPDKKVASRALSNDSRLPPASLVAAGGMHPRMRVTVRTSVLRAAP